MSWLTELWLCMSGTCPCHKRTCGPAVITLGVSLVAWMLKRRVWPVAHPSQSSGLSMGFTVTRGLVDWQGLTLGVS